MLVGTELIKYKNKNFLLSNKTSIYLIVILFFSNFVLKICFHKTFKKIANNMLFS